MPKNKLTLFLLALLILIFTLPLIRSGLQYDYGYGFWGPNGHDGIWHLSLISHFSKNLSLDHPLFSGTYLSNYHWGYDFILGFLSRATGFSPSILYFQIAPILISFFYVFFSFKLSRKLFGSDFWAIVFVTLNVLSGSLGWIYTLLVQGRVAGESLFWSMQPLSFLVNPPFAASLVCLLTSLYFFLEKKYLRTFLFLILGTFFKVYLGAIFITAFGLFLSFNFLRHRQLPSFFKYYLLSIISVIFIFYIYGVFSGTSLLIFRPFWFVTAMIESPDKFFIPSLASYRQSLSQNLSIIKIPWFFFIELSLLAVFIIGNLGFRTLGFISLRHCLKSKDFGQFYLLLLFFLLVSLLPPIFFIQKGTAWNTIQFFYFGLIIANIFFVSFLKQYLSSPFLLIPVLILSCLTSIDTASQYLGANPPASLPTSEITALSFLSRQNPGIILTYPYDAYLKNNFPDAPLPLFAYETSGYVSAFAGMPSFLSDEMNLEITNVDYKPRLNDINKFFDGSYNIFQARGFLVNNQIDYIYLNSTQSLPYPTHDLGLQPIYFEDQISVYQVLR